jgi:hypothetical protein
MKTQKLFPIAALLLMVILACNVPFAQVAGPDLAATYAAQTVSVDQTLAVILNPQTLVAMHPEETPGVIPPTEEPPPPEPTATRTVTPTITLTPQPCSKAKYMDYETIPDDSVIPAGTAFTKLWRVRNDGTCTWTTAYSVYFFSGDQMGAAPSIPLTRNVYPGETYDISIPMTAPTSPGTYTGNWKMKDQNGANFVTNPFYVKIKVQSFSNTMVYNFADNYCSASWVSGAGTLVCPGESGDVKGHVARQDSPKWSNGAQEDEHAILTVPQWVENGVITGTFPAMNIQGGYRFIADIGCLEGGPACNFKYQVNYKVDGGELATLIQGTRIYGEGPTRINVDLSSFAGHSVQFALVILANGTYTQDSAIWLMPSIRR